MPAQGVTIPTKIFFWSGDEAFIVRSSPLKYNGRNFTLLHLQLDDYVKWRYNITDRQLNFKIERQGTYAMAYPRHLIHRVSDNPEHPLSCGFINFDGTNVIDTVLAQKEHELQVKDDIISRLESQIETLQADAKTLSEQLSMLRRMRMEVD